MRLLVPVFVKVWEMGIGHHKAYYGVSKLQ
jgi:hypothetical protein